ncbi:unnamed protein product [Adineta steineri]|uniref:Uncharacterized protein n=1 Tax=Adineta steineri TaxID=433720 RepID=A0A814VER7_9BILA|nr:unnamed protein product [Adineta steineri]CAF1471744.1 unnamed protein product [Adineta steineri]CAF1495206.1 unnamed protein product [Adineta steineri]
MFSSSYYLVFVGIAGVILFISIARYCVRQQYAQRQIMPYPMQVLVLSNRQQHQQLQQPQMCWSVPIEESPPPPYNTVVNPMDPNRNIVYLNNNS